MSLINKILLFAESKKQFSRKELMQNFSDFSQKSVSQQLLRLIEKKELHRVERGVYSAVSSKNIFITDEIKTISSLLQQKFRLAKFCLWNSNFFLSYMHHIPTLNYIYIDVERDAAQSVFHFLIDNGYKNVFLLPNKDVFEKYIVGSKAIIIRVLVSEAPLKTVENVVIPTVEKILVDVVCDVEFDFLQGVEMENFYQNIISKNNINKRKLMRYASRRGQSEEVETLYNNSI
ncbi:MAG: type IV toxin-antitoxin system AbiEi family antitoxin domain-containing protein [Prevotellaceae bacterium]|jgi:predicted transcriptional regulator of viral defense system|nr:type IV toxin-antitoxin system AbiEi family antitoxin domain-containing protein [Prevotellaceae bacterium]